MWKTISAIYDRLERKLRRVTQPLELSANISMASQGPPMQSPSMTSPPDLDDFDPIREIKRLRQDLAHRLQDLQEPDTDGDTKKTANPNVDLEKSLEDPAEELAKEEAANSIRHHMRQAKKILAHLQVRAETSSRSVEVGNRNTEKKNARHEYRNASVRHNGIPVRSSKNEPEEMSATCRADKNCADKKNPDDLLSRKDDPSFQRELTRFLSLEKNFDATAGRADFLKWAHLGLTAFGLLFAVVGIVFCVPLPQDLRAVATIFLLSGVLMAGVGLLGRFFEPTLHRSEAKR